MQETVPHQHAVTGQLRQIVARVSDGVILIAPDETITWANQPALDMHGVQKIQQLGRTISEYRRLFQLCYRNRHPLPDGDYPLERLLSGETFDDVLVDVTPAGENVSRWTHRIRSLILRDEHGQAQRSF